MPGPRRLWTGPHGSALRDRVLEEAPGEATDPWIVPSPLARDQVLHALGRRHQNARGLRVWCWDDLWRAVRDERSSGPMRLSDAAARAALRSAIAQAKRDGVLDEVAEVVEWPGFRRRLVARIATWTRVERHVAAPPPGDAPAIRAQWAIFGRYRDILDRLQAEDAGGFAAWASKALLESPPASLARLGQITILDPMLENRACGRALEHALATAGSVHVTLAYDSTEALGEVYVEAAASRGRLLDLGFSETRVPPDPRRPAGLRGVEHEIFRNDVHGHRLRSLPDGLRVVGAPQGEGLGLVLAREVTGLLEAGATPEGILVLFRHWDDEADVVLETFRAWGLPVASERTRPLAASPAVAALRLAMALPVEDWEAAPLIQLLRNGQLRPDWDEARDPFALATAASLLQSTRVFRGLEPIRRVFDRLQAEGRDDTRKVERARSARAIVERLIAAIGPAAQTRPWGGQVAELRRLAAALGIGGPDDEAIAVLWDALDDQGAVLDRLGRGERRWSWPQYVREVETLTGDLSVPGAAAPSGTIRFATVDAVAGARADWIVLANLGERTFPTREAVNLQHAPATDDESEAESRSGEPAPEGPADPAFAREMLRFLRVIGSADKGVILAYPTSDPQGQELLRAGFLDDLLDLFSPEVAASPTFHTSISRIDPTLSDHRELAGSAADARVLAVARACLRRESAPLAGLARRAEHRTILDGTAAALRVAHARFQSRGFDAFDGRLADPQAIARVVEKFGSEYTFSPSQLESYLFCPFQFFLRYVLKLVPVDERDELEEDYTERGSRTHRVLEQLERMLAQEPASRLDRAEAAILDEMRVDRTRVSEVDSGLHEIERRRLGRSIRRYVRQHEVYERLDSAMPPVPHRFEVVFGFEENDPESHRVLVLGDGPGQVRLQGKIDRIDLLPGAGPSAFRVIDYKTGSCPGKKDVKDALYLQLPLYALAIERIVLDGEGARLHDVGYWGLAAGGFKPIALKDWENDREALEAFVIEVVGQLRQGVFVINSRKDDCTHRCEFGAVCRVGQVRAAGKDREDRPKLELTV